MNTLMEQAFKNATPEKERVNGRAKRAYRNGALAVVSKPTVVAVSEPTALVVLDVVSTAPVLPPVISVEDLPVISEELIAEIRQTDEAQKQWARATGKAVVHARAQIQTINVLDEETRSNPRIQAALVKFQKVLDDAKKAMEDPELAERLKLRELTEEIGRMIRRVDSEEGGEAVYEYFGIADDMLHFLDRLAAAGRFHLASKTEIYNLPEKNGKKVWPSGTFFFAGFAWFSNLRPTEGSKLPAGQEALYMEIRKLIRAFEETHAKRMSDPETSKVGAEVDFVAGKPGVYYLSHEGYEFPGWDEKVVKVRPAQMIVRVYDRNAKEIGKSQFLVVEIVDAGGSALDLLTAIDKFGKVVRRFVTHRWCVNGQISPGNELRKDVYQWSNKFVKHVYNMIIQAGAVAKSE